MKNWERQGIASSLLTQCITYANKLNLQKLDLEVSLKRISAIKLYEKHGFIVDDPENECTAEEPLKMKLILSSEE